MLYSKIIRMKRFIQTTLILTLFLGIVTGCRDRNNGVPLVAVDREINITLPSYSSIAVTGGWVYISGGSKGIIIYRKSTDEFMAYDRHSPYDVDEGCTVNVDSNNVEIIDPCSGSKFSLFSGSVTLGPATLPLKQYSTSFNGTILRVYN